jgi:hypothetical protein
MTTTNPVERLKVQVAAQEHDLAVSREILERIEKLQGVVLELFNNKLPRQEFPVDIANDGVTRIIRGFTLDEDAYSGHLSNEVWTGAALIDEDELGVLVVEEHYPSSTTKGTHFSQFNIGTGELSYHREDRTSRGDKPIPGADVLVGEEKAKILNRLVGVIGRFADNYTTPYTKNRVGSVLYEFETELLR